LLQCRQFELQLELAAMQLELACVLLLDHKSTRGGGARSNQHVVVARLRPRRRLQARALGVRSQCPCGLVEVCVFLLDHKSTRGGGARSNQRVVVARLRPRRRLQARALGVRSQRPCGLVEQPLDLEPAKLRAPQALDLGISLGKSTARLAQLRREPRQGRLLSHDARRTERRRLWRRCRHGRVLQGQRRSARWPSRPGCRRHGRRCRLGRRLPHQRGSTRWHRRSLQLAAPLAALGRPSRLWGIRIHDVDPVG
jgi:hypothetical protein